MDTAGISRRSALARLAVGAVGAAAAGPAAAEQAAGAPAGAGDAKPWIWDLHVHIAGVPGATPRERMEALVRFADRMGIERMCVHLGMTVGPNNPDPEALRKYNDEAIAAFTHRPERTVGFVYLNPNHLEFSLQEFDRCVRDGPMTGVKLWTARRCSAKELDPIVRRAADHKAVIYQHTWFKTEGNPEGESTPTDMAELAGRHPEVPLICGHTGGNWERGIRAIRARKNVSIDLAGSDPTTGIVEMAVRELGAERIIYGSDVGGRSFASQLSKVLGADVPQAAKRLILRENLRRMMLPILTKRGIKA
jgi:hypothetical protein